MISIRKKKNEKKVTQSFIFSRLDGLIYLYLFDTNKLNNVLLLINLTFCGSAYQWIKPKQSLISFYFFFPEENLLGRKIASCAISDSTLLVKDVIRCGCFQLLSSATHCKNSGFEP